MCISLKMNSDFCFSNHYQWLLVRNCKNFHSYWCHILSNHNFGFSVILSGLRAVDRSRFFGIKFVSDQILDCSWKLDQQCQFMGSDHKPALGLIQCTCSSNWSLHSYCRGREMQHSISWNCFSGSCLWEIPESTSHSNFQISWNDFGILYFAFGRKIGFRYCLSMFRAWFTGLICADDYCI